jgi:hypothetical protein
MLGYLSQALNPVNTYNNPAIRTILTLNNLLNKTDQSKATNLRDKVFALLNIASDIPLMSFLVNYNIPLEEVYIVVIRRIISLEDDLAILGFINYTA